MASQWVRSGDVVWEELDGEAVLVSTSAQKTWVLNATASLIWKCCDGQISLEAVARRLARAGGREAGRVKRELQAFCQILEQKGLLSTARAAMGSMTGERLPAELCFAGLSLPPQIKMETTSMGLRGRPSPRGVTGGP